jgi:GxxExxY protein
MLEKYADLPPEQEAIVSAVIGCAINVHRILGPGFKECIYHTALRLEFESGGLAYESEKPIEVKYRHWNAVVSQNDRNTDRSVDELQCSFT